MKQLLSGGLVAASCASALAVPAAASAAPVTVNLRVEGASQTLYEGPVTTDARTINAPASTDPKAPADHPCNFKDNGSNGGFGPTGGTPTTALYDATRASSETFGATWSRSLNDFFVTQVGPDANKGAPNYESWGFAVNYTTSNVGGCQTILGAGNDVVWAYDFFSKSHLLKLSGPASVVEDDPATYTVVDGQSGDPISGASVGGRTSDAQGHVTLTFPDPGTQRLKAERADSVRSNRIDTTVTARSSGGTTQPSGGTTQSSGGTTQQAQQPGGGTVFVRDVFPPFARITFPSEGQAFTRRSAPRVLRAEADDIGSGVMALKMRLTRRVGPRCSYFNGQVERFLRTRCGGGYFFTVTRQGSFDYLLPKRLGRGRYVFDVTAVDRRYNRDDQRRRGSNRVVFVVR